jgi:RNA-directed DNA polymerase
LKGAKSFEISKWMVLEAFKRVRANKGAAGIDEESIKDFEKDLKNNLYKIWNRMSSGTYFPPPVKAVAIPKKNGGERILGIPTVADRTAQMVVKLYIEPKIDPVFHEDSYGYRPKKSALQAIGKVRERCWRFNWVLEFDIKGLFDNIDHDLLLKAVRFHIKEEWILLYITRWLKAPFLNKDGKIEMRERGTPQGGVVSPILANLFLHYVFDHWMEKNHPDNPIVRYADDGVAHCKSELEAKKLLDLLKERFKACKLEIHPDKTKIVYCKDSDRQGNYHTTSFDFLGYTFRPRRSKNRYGKHFINFTPAVSRKACIAMRQTTREWKIRMRSDKSIQDISKMYNPVIRGWMNYYGKYYKSAMYPVLRHFDETLVKWTTRKFKRFKRHRRRARYWLGNVARTNPRLFAHWQMGIKPAIGKIGAV